MSALRCDYNSIHQVVQTQPPLLGCTKHKLTFVLISQGTREIRLTGPAMARDPFSHFKTASKRSGKYIAGLYFSREDVVTKLYSKLSRNVFVLGAGLSEIVRIVKISFEIETSITLRKVLCLVVQYV